MKLKFISAVFLPAAFGASIVMADAVLSVNGCKVEKAVTHLAFEGDNVKVTFGDHSESSYDMGEVSFAFAPSAGVESASSFSILTISVGDLLEISGLTNGGTLQVFDMQGKLSAQATSSGDSCKIDISHLQGGAYILKAGNEIVKFIKR